MAELTQVEGEGALYVRASGGRVEEARLDIYEPPRYFEAFLRGRAHTEPPDITARICGIGPVAYQRLGCQIAPHHQSRARTVVIASWRVYCHFRHLGPW